ncbi:MAG: oxidoreductase [Acidobacteria bacterium]|nr:oxidoreductase [Acidobacteriota bacterium]
MDSIVRKPKIATVWLGGCSGCHMSFLDLDERLIELASKTEICYSPVIDIKEFPRVDFALVEGAVANEDHLHEIHHIRERCRVLIAFGDCAVTSNVTGMRNLFPLQDLMRQVYKDEASPSAGIPSGGVVPKLLERVRPLHEVVHVDHFLPGCPPSADAIWNLLMEVIAGNPPNEPRRFG